MDEAAIDSLCREVHLAGQLTSAAMASESPLTPTSGDCRVEARSSHLRTHIDHKEWTVRTDNVRTLVASKTVVAGADNAPSPLL